MNGVTFNVGFRYMWSYMVYNGSSHKDFHIVGASFAGSLLAVKLAERNQKVALIDRKQPGSTITCGGGMPRDTFDRLNLDVPFVPINRVLFSINGKKRFFNDNYVVVDRRELDSALCERALENGAELTIARYMDYNADSKSITVKTNGEETQVNFNKLVIATGVNLVRFPYLKQVSKIPAKPKVSSARVEIIDQESPFPNQLYIHINKDLVGGYCWAFPMPEGKTNIGGGNLAGGRIKSGFFQRFKKEFKFDGKVIARGGGVLPFGPTKSVMNGSTSLFGDTAGMVYPPNGEGLKYIEKFADIWADALINDYDLNKIWRRSLTYKKFKFVQNIGKQIIGLESATGFPAYVYCTRLATLLKKIIS